ncbi:hypothetical protein [Methylobacterium sp. ARG-1]|uniref:hypothetical protein n=1 Tax=Methylobacterium sp. ARG-1 TaxID=1692501 RepID=UPI0011873FC3|nr:hypothetical protein [Methylobacterium sp. ARG-1]
MLSKRTRIDGRFTFARAARRASTIAILVSFPPSTAKSIGAILACKDRAERERVGRSGRPMTPDIRESRAALILLAAVVGAVLLFGAFTLITQIG